MSFILLFGLLVVSILVMLFSAWRFAARARRAGRWDEAGPVVETQGPPDRVRNAGMEERLEVIGEWDPPIVNDRRREEKD